MQGTMLWYNRAKRYGFIETEDGERLRVDEEGFAAGELLAERCRGTQVIFDRIGEEAGGARAVNVAVVPSVVARRARSRGRR